ncbi:hypothetical protein IC617_10245 [Neiella sp. HB171785]|uniref:Uncharacterized protein n=1 Tax=Neiella litorisoli TaxID=2771431 RepID=A0A8J6UPZ0_9GAMM|nr:hypothetical protein [Neiella litorisoli]MBD1389807.1 hypothetical protein [Neiella litorisoli]
MSFAAKENLAGIWQRLSQRVSLWLWPEQQEADCSSRCYYCYKPYPIGLKGDALQQWAALQAQRLNPYHNGHSYSYLAKSGVAIWVSPSPFQGIPETACQQAMPDGTHVLHGNEQLYKQRWLNGSMVECLSIASQQELGASPTAINTQAPWAINHPFEQLIAKPVFWALTCSVVAFICLLWLAVGYTALSFQSILANERSAQIELELGDKLTQQMELQSQQSAIAGLSRWRMEYGVFPEAFAVVASIINQQGDWVVDVVQWQNKRLSIEFKANSLDITQVVSNLENSSVIANASIRPGSTSGVWIVEVGVK